MKKKVICAMSGGVDSAVSAYLLKEMGYEVVGVTCKVWFRGDDQCNLVSSKSCCGDDSIFDARKTADQIGIKHYVFNYEELFKKEVIDKFCLSYSEGVTPNPCMDCNRVIRSQSLLKKALGMNFDYLATGHYIRKVFDEEKKVFKLKRGIDKNKDQSYFLYQMNQEEVSRMLFPLGEYTKDQVRKIALKAGINVAKKPESQDICFIPEGNHGKFIEKTGLVNLPNSKIYNIDGDFLGEGKPIYYYTVGQRRGLNIALGERAYVVDIVRDENKIILGSLADLIDRGLIGKDLYEQFRKIIHGEEIYIKIRYRSNLKRGRYFIEGEKFRIEFLETVKGVTRGQGAVFYELDGETLLGGGTITDSIK